MSLLLDALKQAEKNKESTEDSSPIIDIDDSLLDDESSAKETVSTDVIQPPVGDQVASHSVEVLQEQVTDVAEPIVSAETIDKEEVDAVEKPKEIETINFTEEPVEALNTQSSAKKLAPTQTIDPALNVFAAGGNATKRPDKSKEKLLVGILGLLIVLAIALYFWPIEDEKILKYNAAANTGDTVGAYELTEGEPQTNTNTAEKVNEAAQPVAVNRFNSVIAETSNINSEGSVVQAPALEPVDTGIKITKRTSSRALINQLGKAYSALRANDLETSTRLYRKVLQRYSNQMDAELGLANIATRKNDMASARRIYEGVLSRDATNKTAQLGLLFTYQNASSQEKISALKDMDDRFENQPEVLVAIGHELAKKSKWSDAQSYYFKAFGLDKNNAVLAYNLAVSLDRMGKYQPAIVYYKKVLLLSSSRTTELNRAGIQSRILELGEIR